LALDGTLKFVDNVFMTKFKRLTDAYRYPGFIPVERVKGMYGDPHAVVITLRRRQKEDAMRDLRALATIGL
jgi:hypothetical protein